MRRARVAVLAPYWDFFATSARGDLATDRAALLRDIRTGLAAHADVVIATTIDPDVPVAATIEAVRGARPDLLVLAATMASPPAAALRVVDAFPELPVVLWAARRGRAMAEPYTHQDITVDGATVGAPQLASLLARASRPFDVVMAALDDPDGLSRVHDAVRSAAAAVLLRTARIGRVGGSLPGYTCVDADAPRLADEVGARVIEVPAAEFLARYQAVDAAVVERTWAETRHLYHPTTALPGWKAGAAPAAEVGEPVAGQVADAVRAAVALRELGEAHRLDAGAFNCHVPQIRRGPAIGYAPCFALGHCTSLGVPWTCTGDVVTAIAMLTAKALSGAALYHELEALDPDSGEFVIANSGEHDLAFGPGPAELRTNPWWPTGLCAVLTPRPGPATLIGFAQLDPPGGHRLIAARGRFTARKFPGVGTSNAAFAFDRTPPEHAWEAWCRSGVNHHAAATPGDHAEHVQRVAGHLKLPAIVI
ncbi:hypothetical protein [Spongiactinospora sp. 9N601]|uniref:hypothetical protein n=1 Tax=Spongiactinospora sp. 9N601 TaxID=3375149 RepID=UPI0037AED09D